MRVGRIGHINDGDWALTAAADVGTVLGERQPRVEASGAQVVVADFLQRSGLVGSLNRGERREGQDPQRQRQRQQVPSTQATTCDGTLTASPTRVRSLSVTRRQR